MAIDQLSQGTPTSGAQIPFFNPTTGADERAPLSAVAEVLQPLLSAPGQFRTQYASPNATGFSVAIAPPTKGASVFLLLTPVAGYAAGTITLPAAVDAMDGQEVLVHCTQAVTTLTVNGGTVNGAPTTIAAFGFFRMRFDGVFRAWYRVG